MKKDGEEERAKKEIKNDINNNLISQRESGGRNYYYKWINNEQIDITKQEFYKIKKIRTEFLKRKHVPRYEILDI